MPGRRWSDGLHQAVEAKEGVPIQSENQTLASITFQNYFRMYGKLAGMTGTADTEAYEFQEIYGLETVVIPTQHADDAARTSNDLVYQTAQREVRRDHRRHPAIATSAASRCWSARRRSRTPSCCRACCNKDKLPHQVLNAKQHAREAEIVAQAGRPKMITIATNMAGRGTDIVLGGNVEKQIEDASKPTRRCDAADEGARDRTSCATSGRRCTTRSSSAGGLHIIGTERHESRRIDNQLRGRSGRQGDPGSSRFYLSLDDPLLRIFAGDRVRAIMERLKMPEGEADRAPASSRARSRARSARSRRATSTSASSCSNTTTSPTTSAR